MPAKHQAIWSRACGILRGAIRADRINPILANVAPVELGPRVVLLAGADGFWIDTARDQYAAYFAEAFSTVLEREVLVEFEVRDGDLVEGAQQSAIEQPQLWAQTPAPITDARQQRRLAYTLSPFAQVAPLPMSSGEAHWSTSQGHTRLDATSTKGLPHGGLGRRLLVHLVTAVIRSGLVSPGAGGLPKDPEPIEISPSLAALIRAVGGKSDSGGAKGARAAITEQLAAMLATTWQIREGESEISLRLFDEEVLTLEARKPVLLTPTKQLLELARNRMVCLDQATVHEMGRDCTALDLYCWATWRNHPHQDRKAVFISLESMAQQLGRTWKRSSAWAKRLAEGLARVQQIYRHLDARMQKVRGYLRPALRLAISSPHISPGSPPDRPPRA
ncbi:MAG: replication protein RepA [Bradymonadia bacterium]